MRSSFPCVTDVPGFWVQFEFGSAPGYRLLLRRDAGFAPEAEPEDFPPDRKYYYISVLYIKFGIFAETCDKIDGASSARRHTQG
jgi:hypothetical protein